MAQSGIRVGDIRDNCGPVNVAGGDIYEGYTAEQVAALLAQIASEYQPIPFDGRCPYKGLDAFEEEDAEFFFGRERLINELVGRVRAGRTLFITGPSGSGKSSLVRAGLMHALREGAIEDLQSERWRFETIKPGRDPLAALALAFSRLKSPELAEYFRGHLDNPGVLNECAESVLSNRSSDRLVLFIDQFEEVFTQVRQEDLARLIRMLAECVAADAGRVIFLFSMRSEFIANCAPYAQLNALLNRQLVQVGAMDRDELLSAIARPALKVGLRVDPDLIAQVISDMQGVAGALPLMQFALQDLFRAERTPDGIVALTRDAYIERGGIYKSLERHANEAFARLSPGEQDLARSIFVNLVDTETSQFKTKNTAWFSELVATDANPEMVRGVVQKLADARLVTTDRQAGRETVTLSHEKLIEAWPWLHDLVEKNREAIAFKKELDQSARQWEEHGRDKSRLYRGEELASAQQRIQSLGIKLTRGADTFIKASQQESADQLQRTRRQVAILRVALGVAVVGAVFAIFYAYQAQANAKMALARQLVAQAQSIISTRSSKQMIAVLLATRSLQMSPSSEAEQVLLGSTGATTVAHTQDDAAVLQATFSPDGKFVAAAVGPLVRIWEAGTGLQVATMQHDDLVYAVAFSPNGKYVASASRDNTARVWDASTGKEILRAAHQGPAYALAFSPDGVYLASAGFKTIYVRKVATGTVVAKMNQVGEIHTLAFSPDGNYLAAGDSKTARVWSLETGKEVERMPHGSPVNSVAFSPDGMRVISGSDDGTARVWEAASGQEICRMTHAGSVTSVAFSPDGKYALSGSRDNTARVWDAMTGAEVARLVHEGSVFAVAFSPDGKYVVSAGDDDTARVWDPTSGEEVARMTHDSWITSVMFSANGEHVLSASDDGTARVWRPMPGAGAYEVLYSGAARAAVFSPDGQYVAGGGGSVVRVWETVTGRQVVQVLHDDIVSAVAFSPDGRYIASVSHDRTARVWDAMTGKEVARVSYADSVTCVAFSPDGQWVAAGSDDRTARVWETITGKERARMTHAGPVNSVSFSPDGKLVVSTSDDKTIRIWDAVSGTQIRGMALDSTALRAVFSPDGKLLVSGDGTSARTWDVESGQEIAKLGYGYPVYSAAFSPDGRWVLSGSGDIASVWEAATGKEQAFMNHDGTIQVVAFSPDGRYAISGDDRTARVWSTTTGAEVARMAHDNLIHAVAFSPDGRYALSAGHDQAVRVWLWRPEDLIATACQSVPHNLSAADWNHYMGDSRYELICPGLPKPVSPPGAGTPEAN